MNNTYSTPASPADWVQCYERALPGESFGQISSVEADSTVVSTSITPISGISNHLNPEGRVSKPARRRRASRAAPTTLVNTDTLNFRAMVQQFTGVSNSSLTFATPNEAQNISFRANGNTMAQGQGYHNQYQQHQQQQQQYVFSLENRGDSLLSSLGNTRPTSTDNLEASDGFFMGNDSSSSSQMFPRGYSSSHNNRNNGYIQ